MECIILAIVVYARPSEDLADVVRLDGVLGDDAKLATAPPHSLSKIRVGSCIDIDDGTVSHHSLPTNDAVSRQTFLRTEEGDAALEQISTDAHEA